MKRILLAACLALGACTPGQINSAGSAADAAGVPAPATYANRTAADEQALFAVEGFYKAARLAVETGVDAGLIKGATASRFADLDNRAYLALAVVRGAYRTGNSQTYHQALADAQLAIKGLLSLTGR
jgi:hypothetical protein